MAVKTLPKTVAEIRTYEFPFQNQPEILRHGAAITSIDPIAVTDPTTGSPLAGLTLGSPSIGPGSEPPNLPNSSVYVEATGGANATRYMLDVKANLDTGAKLEAAGVLSVRNLVGPTV